ncbi:endonuclease [Actinomyces sp. S6-Spd3]|uniref:ExeM/NucH family extracellular endonuclease n=1 Tax=Actinomyces sp. S6-Spd3 TaxID=1284680 RepID=UPI00050EB4FB|nr:ExeM/NucH family extracellular endonuclease [Actinomyces sp. S6-Spd3]KGF00345.1 endonuclease [Actinomyces sp. S6-Spd3]
MLRAKKRTVIGALAAFSLFGMPLAAYADPSEDPTSGSETQASTPTPSVEASAHVRQTRAVSALVSIPDIQTPGDGDDSQLINQTVETKGVVTAAYPKGENANLKGLEGFTIQTPGTGGTWDPARTASDGLFVFMGKSSATMPSIGDCVVVKGKVAEYSGVKNATAATQSLTQLLPQSITAATDCDPVKPTELSGVPTQDQMEALESMLVLPKDTWTITDNYKTNRYGTLSLTPGTEVLRTATDVVAPGAAAQAYEAENAAKTIDLDDASTTDLTNFKQNGHKERYAYLANGAPARVGYHVTFTKPVVLESRFGSFVFQPTQMTAGNPDRSPVTITGERPAAPSVSGDTKVATFNVLNYFSDLGENEPGCKGYEDRDHKYVTDKNCKLRGAWSSQAFANQQTKIVQAINTIDADVVALEEIENPVASGVSTDRDGALKSLVNALNAAAGSEVWAYVPSPSTVPANEDVIRIAFIYKKAKIAPVGDSVIYDDPAYTGLARQPLAQEFKPITDVNHEGKNFVVIANHFKSKGSAPKNLSGAEAAANTDNGDGQGNSNGVRVKQARALATFAQRFNGTPTLLVGDFNAYTMEDPLKVLTDAGWAHESGHGDSSYVYGGRSGSMDHVFANSAAHPLITEVKSWAVNAQESIAFEYSRANYNAYLAFEADNPYRASDHNPEIIGLNLITPIAQPPVGPSAQPSDQASTNPSAPAGNPEQSASATKAKQKRSKLASTGVNETIPLALGALVLGVIACAMRRRTL